jgi:hypothetical protein
MISPTRSPPASAGPPGRTSPIRTAVADAPAATAMRRGIGSVWAATPRWARPTQRRLGSGSPSPNSPQARSIFEHYGFKPYTGKGDD